MHQLVITLLKIKGNYLETFT